jgi:hypothetical protein
MPSFGILPKGAARRCTIRGTAAGICPSGVCCGCASSPRGVLLLPLLLALLLGVATGPRAAARLLLPLLGGSLLCLGARRALLLVCKVLQHLLSLLRPGCCSVIAAAPNT